MQDARCLKVKFVLFSTKPSIAAYKFKCWVLLSTEYCFLWPSWKAFFFWGGGANMKIKFQQAWGQWLKAASKCSTSPPSRESFVLNRTESFYTHNVLCSCLCLSRWSLSLPTVLSSTYPSLEKVCQLENFLLLVQTRFIPCTLDREAEEV